MPNPSDSRYSQYLHDLAAKKTLAPVKGKAATKSSKKAQAASQNKGEKEEDRRSKKRKREAVKDGPSVSKEPNPALAATKDEAATSASATVRPTNPSEPGLSSGLSQNVNGSEQTGRKGRENFVTQLLNSATASQGAPPPTTGQGAPPATASPKQAPQSSDLPGAQPEDEDTEMADQSDQSDDEDDFGLDETPQEVAYLKRLKDLYATQSDKATQQALLTVLEELSQESNKKDKRGRPQGQSNSPWDQNDEYYCSDGPRRREKQRVALSGYVRLILGQLLGVKDAKSPLPHGPPPEIAAPTAARFYVKWGESEKSEFNAIAARIVALQVVADYPSLCELHEMHDMVTMHIKYLRARYRRQTIPEYISKEPQRLRSASAGVRKRTLYEHRLRVINAIPALARHGRLFETLGLEGTSSDEEDPARPGIYLIRRRKPLSRQVSHLKNQVDQAFSIQFKGPGSRGNRDRKRVESNLVSTRRFRVKGLPLSCMDPAWLATLTEVQKSMFEFRDMQYDFAFPEEFLQPPEGW
ncbi:hypothetical protein FRC12_014184 [Ceratobasidium sp. 428]|nr:hypothetical protein FRC12_014184 [Ceratobasidium sp. 428]